LSGEWCDVPSGCTHRTAERAQLQEVGQIAGGDAEMNRDFEQQTRERMAAWWLSLPLRKILVRQLG